MKSLKTLCLGLAILAMSSCKNDDNVNSNASLLEGTWNLAGFVYSGTNTTTTDTETSVRDITGEAINLDMRYTFANNPNIITKEGRFDVEVNTTFEGNTSSQTVPSTTISTGLGNGATYSLNGDQLITSYSNGTQIIFDVESLTDSRLVLISIQDESLEQDGQTFTSMSEGTITLTR